MKYAPLRSFFEKLSVSKRHVSLRFDEIEEILNARLPKSAFEYREWWANQSYGSQAPSWRDAGFMVDGVDLKRKLVRFRRDAEPKAKEKAFPTKRG